ncbi:GAF domain-containing protein [Halalkalibacter sp. APA_J-10(15)]|uniref:GAF domain-containing protein n=1 Tax=Halalkalibacter sp. APA_J-10(15) TaxID=2933805 RepID=UPI001FF4008B|nr:GAF domain-containing protein [Halalkalibacter sp. APA_J-10(15)]MCK0472459.1 GAF domain-containing protein [Halalkalibacter sp. APA_J-10(15)]
MSIPTDIASLQIMAQVYKKESMQTIFEKTVESLVEQVLYIDWAGIYIYEQLDHKLVAASSFEDDLKWECNGELKFPITNSSDEEIGMLIVRSRQPIAFDVTDVSTLETIATAIGQESFAN